MIRENSYSVDIAMMRVARSPVQLYSLGLGSCVGVAIYDPVAKIGGLIHILLPSMREFSNGTHVRAKFADSGISDLVELMVQTGAAKYRMSAKMAGGAAMFASAAALRINSIGERNIQSCRETLAALGIRLISQDTGGNRGRTIYFDVETGALTIKTIDRPEKTI